MTVSCDERKGCRNWRQEHRLRSHLPGAQTRPHSDGRPVGELAELAGRSQVGRKSLIVAWLCLFGGTLAVCTFRSKPASLAQSVAADQAEAESVQQEFEAMPTKTPVVVLNQVGDSVTRAFTDTIASYIRTNEDGLRGCRKQLMQHSGRVSEYFEVSFVPYQDATGAVTLRDLVLERATLDLSHDEESCLLDEFKKMKLGLSSSIESQGRVAYQFCFHRLEGAG